nr:hypothetical protein [uncultured Cohaesibacter sp.]
MGENQFLIMKRGLYYVQDDAKRTGIKALAGRYPINAPECNAPDVTVLNEDLAPEFAPGCFDDEKVEFLTQQNEQLREEAERLTKERDRLQQLANSANAIFYKDLKVLADRNKALEEALTTELLREEVGGGV